MNTRIFFKLSFGIFLAWNALAQIFTGQTWWFIQNVNLVFHEAGHVLFYPFPHFLTLIAGSIIEIAVPFSITCYFIVHHKFMSAVFGSWWLATATLSVSIYAADANERVLPLITGDINTHDWYNILQPLGLLQYDDQFGFFFWCASLASVILLLVVLTYDKDVKNLFNSH